LSDPFVKVEEFPNFQAIKGIENRKREFFNFLRPIIIEENERILEQRARLLSLLEKQKAGENDLANGHEWLDQVFYEYRLDSLRIEKNDMWKYLMRRIDIIPVELVLAQGATESAWGTSRFAIYGNSLFGQWTYSDEKSMIPQKRKKGANHRVASYKSVKLAVRSYMRNLNTHWAYGLLREKRQELRKENKSLDGYILADGLLLYSEKREKYVKNIKNIIRVNKPLMGNLPSY